MSTNRQGTALAVPYCHRNRKVFTLRPRRLKDATRALGFSTSQLRVF
jgi:hypothetical protein